MLIGFALIIVAVFLCCALLFRLSVHALPLFVAFAALWPGLAEARVAELTAETARLATEVRDLRAALARYEEGGR